MAITIEPLGGLGNQLFTYALGKELSSRLSTDLVADLRNFRGYEWHEYELDSFGPPIPIAADADRRSPIVETSQRLARRLGYRPKGTVGEQVRTFDASILDAPNGSRLRGYFQSWRYFPSVADLIRAEMRQLLEPSEWFARTSAYLSHIHPWTAVHIRRGNYVDIPSMGIAKLDYYERALGLLDKLEGRTNRIIFSDSPDLVRSTLDRNFLNSVEILESPAEVRPIEILLLMSFADHMVTANSTFSWWAAWLGERSGRRVICPRPWLDDPGHNDRDLLVPSWISLGR